VAPRDRRQIGARPDLHQDLARHHRVILPAQRQVRPAAVVRRLNRAFGAGGQKGQNEASQRDTGTRQHADPAFRGLKHLGRGVVVRWG